MKCDKWQEKIIDRVADELSEQETVILEQHLAQCRYCLEKETQIKRFVNPGSEEYQAIPHPALEEKLVKQMREIYPAESNLNLINNAGRKTTDRDEISSDLPDLITSLKLLFRRAVPVYTLFLLVFSAAVIGFLSGRDFQEKLFVEGVSSQPSQFAGLNNTSLIQAANSLATTGAVVARDSIKTINQAIKVLQMSRACLRPEEKYSDLDLSFNAAQIDAIRFRSPVNRDSL